MGRGAHRHLPREAAEPQPQGPGGRAYRAVARPGESTDSGATTAHSMPRAWYTHGACLVYAWRTYWAGDARWLARALRWGGAIDRVGHLGPGRAALARAHPDDARHDVATQQGQSAWARSGPWPPTAPDAHSLAQGHPLGPNPPSATADSTPFCVWPSQARGGGGHACGGHAATILRLLRGGGIHARPSRGMKCRACALALHCCSV